MYNNLKFEHNNNEVIKMLFTIALVAMAISAGAEIAITLMK